MKDLKKIIGLVALLAIILTAASSVAAILLDDGGDPYIKTSMRGQQIELYGGDGIYRYDTLVKAVMFRGFDWANLFVCLPLFVISLFLFKRNKISGYFLLGGLFCYLFYGYLIGVLGNAYNGLFLVWTGMFSTGLVGVILIICLHKPQVLLSHLKPTFPIKSLGVYMIVLGIMLPTVYLIEIIGAYVTGTIPVSLGPYTTLDLAALEIGIMAPLHIITGILLFKRKPWTFLLAIILTFTASIMFISLSVYQALFFFVYDKGNLVELIQLTIFTLAATGFSIAILVNINHAPRALDE